MAKLLPAWSCLIRGPPLKSIPKAVRSSAAYAEARERQELARDQIRRWMDSLEGVLRNETVLSAGGIEHWLQLPGIQKHLQSLVLRSRTGEMGLIDSTGRTLEDIDGRVTELRGPVSLAHPLRIYQAGQLQAWQRRICARRLAQSVRQVFREIYFRSEAEESQSVSTERFAGNCLRSRVAAKLLQSRGWRMESGDSSLAYRIIPDLRMQAVLDFPDAGHYLTETETITTGRLYFLEHPLPLHASRKVVDFGPRLPFGQVPAVVFSEVMRDVDLAVSVASQEEGRLSMEAFQKRGEMVMALCEVLGIPGVTVKHRHAHIDGQIASYRVHLATSMAHVSSGAQLPDLPGAPGHVEDALRLLAGPEGSWLHDVLTKIAALSMDASIDDPIFRRRIQQGR